MNRSHSTGWFWCLRRSLTVKPIANMRGLDKTLLVKAFLAFYVLILLLAAPLLVKAPLKTVKTSLQKYFGALCLYFTLSFVLAMVLEIAFLIKRKRFRVSRIWNVTVFSFCHMLFTSFILAIYKESLGRWHADLLGDEIGLSFDGSRLIILVFVFILSAAAFFENLRVLFSFIQR